MNRIVLVALLLTMVTISSCVQKKKNLLIGTWERVEEVKKEPQIIIGGNADNKKIEVLLNFKDEKNIKIKQGPRIFDAEYVVKEKDLTLGNRKYQILKLDSDSLIMKEYSDWSPKTYKYFKTTKKIEEK